MLNTPTTDPFLRDAIKKVGIGKKGSIALNKEDLTNLKQSFKNEATPTAAQGAFLGALFIKGLTADEDIFLKQLFHSHSVQATDIINFICPHCDEPIKSFCQILLEMKTLSRKEAYQLGKILFSQKSGDGARGLIASILRVRYETIDEYQGLLESMQDFFELPFKKEIPAGDPIIQIADPFDGATRTYLITPLISQFLQKKNYRVINLVGDSSGPKYGNNMNDIALRLSSTFIKDNGDLANSKPEWGWYLHQRDLSPALQRWVTLRRAIIKRPFLATLERFVNPCQAQILIASAFHPNYGEKMQQIAQRAGFPGIIIIRNGMEGSTAFALLRPTKILISAKQENGQYLNHEIDFNPAMHLASTIPKEERLLNPSLEENCQLIQEYSLNGSTSNSLFNQRVECTCRGIYDAVQWIQNSFKLGGRTQ